jgi:flagellar basal-body rod protein FlgG
MKALYTAATGMAAQQQRIENIAHNLANVSTVGFKKSRENFEDLLYENLPVSSPDQNTTRASTLQLGSGVRLASMSRDFTNGDLTATGNTFDLALAGRGFFVVQDTAGNQFFTRNGQFGLNAEGELITQSGLRVDPNIEIPMDASEVRVSEDGTISAVFADSPEPVTLGTLRVVDFVNRAGLRAMGGNLYTSTPESGMPLELNTDDGINIKQGFVEASNVDVAEELINMITAQRAFELTSKAVEAADQAMQVANNIKR